MKKSILFVVFLIFLFLISFNQNPIMDWLISHANTSWTTSYWLPKIGVVLFSILAVINFPLKKTFKFRLPVLMLLFVGFLGISFALSPIFVEDLNKEGISISSDKYDNNQTLKAINHQYPDFDGVVAIASPTCPHCMAAAKKFNTLKLRNPEIDVLFVMFTLKQESLDGFRNETDATNIDYMLAPDEQGVLEICEERFPVFVYLKNQKIVHRWTNNDLGYPAYDWVESGLK